MRPRGFRCLWGGFEVRSRDEAVAKGVEATDFRVEKEIFLKIADGLVNADSETDAAEGQRFKRDDLARGDVGADVRGDVRMDGGPLAGPAGAHRVNAADVAAFHAVGPFDVRVHARQHGFRAAGIEVAAGAGQEAAFVHFYSGWLGPMMQMSGRLR